MPKTRFVGVNINRKGTFLFLTTNISVVLQNLLQYVHKALYKKFTYAAEIKNNEITR